MAERIELLWANKVKMRLGQQMKEHNHTCYQLYYIISGSAIYLLGGTAVPVKAGQYFLVPPTVPHSMLPLETDDFLCYEYKFLINENGLAELVDNTCPREDTGAILSLLTYIIKNWRFSSEGNKRNIDSILSAVLISFFSEQVTYQDPASMFIDLTDHSPAVRSAVIYIERHYPYRFSLEKLASRLNYHKNYISSMFGRETGHTIMEYVNLLRLRYAVICFVFYGQDVASAYECAGFRNGSYFSRNFSEHIGVSARCFRARLSDPVWREQHPQFFREPIITYQLSTMDALFASLHRLGAYMTGMEDTDSGWRKEKPLQ